MKKFLIVLIILFICGVLIADIYLVKIEESILIGKGEFYKQYAFEKLVFKDIFWNMLYERIKYLSILVLLCFTPVKRKLSGMLISIFSFVWGFFVMSCIMELGVVGLVVGLASVIPHGLFYGGTIWIIVRDSPDRGHLRRNKVIKNFVSYILAILLFITACVIESLMGTHFIPWIIRLSLV